MKKRISLIVPNFWNASRIMSSKKLCTCSFGIYNLSQFFILRAILNYLKDAREPLRIFLAFFIFLEFKVRLSRLTSYDSRLLRAAQITQINGRVLRIG